MSEPHFSSSAEGVEGLLYSLEKGLLTNADKQEIAKLLRAAAQPVAKPVAWRYKCADGSLVLLLDRLTDEQKRRGYYTGEDGEDEVDGDEAIVGPFHWAEETPLYAAQPPAAPVETEEDITAALNARQAAINESMAHLPCSAETAIAALAKRFWSIHPKEIQDLGITREQFYEREMRALFAALVPNEPQQSGVVPTGAIEPGLEGTIIGKLRLFMRSVCIWERSPAQIIDALSRAGLELAHKQDASSAVSRSESK